MWYSVNQSIILLTDWQKSKRTPFCYKPYYPVDWTILFDNGWPRMLRWFCSWRKGICIRLMTLSHFRRNVITVLVNSHQHIILFISISNVQHEIFNLLHVSILVTSINYKVNQKRWKNWIECPDFMSIRVRFLTNLV